MSDTEQFNLPTRCLREDKLRDDGFDVLEILNDIYRKENKKEWTRKVGVYHPSSMRGCKRALYYDRIGTPPVSNVNPFLQSLFDLGHAIHEKLQARLLTTPHAGRVAEEVPSSCPELNMYGSCDLIFWDPDWIVEIKSISDAKYKILVKAHLDHVWQVHCYMFMHDIPRAQIVYYNRNNGRMRIIRIQFSNKIWDEIVDVINFVDDHVARCVEPPREVSSYSCRGCKFNYVCEPEI